MSTSAELTCADVVELVTNYLEGVMPAEERQRFQEHLDDCEGCTNYLEQMRATIALTGRLTEDDLPEPVRRTLVAVFRDWKRG